MLAKTGPPAVNLYSCLLWTVITDDDVSSFGDRFPSNTATARRDGIFLFLVTSFTNKQATFLTTNEIKNKQTNKKDELDSKAAD